jgi:hypothetical protein
MKLSRLLLPLLLTVVSAVTAATFEGKVTLGMRSGKDKEVVVAYTLKEGFARMEPKIEGAEGMASIINWSKMEMIMLMADQQMYMVMPLKGAMAGAAEATGAHDTKVQKTGETETILGYLCEKYVTTDRGDTVEMWVTDKLGTFMGIQSGGGGPMGGMFGGGGKKKGGWEEAVKGKENFFPMRVVGKNAKGKETFRMETKSVEPGSVPASAFTVPDGWQKFQMPSIGDLFKG